MESFIFCAVSTSVRVIECFRILKAFMILSYLIFMDNVLNQNEKALEETLACSSSKAVKTALGGLRRLNKDRCAIAHTPHNAPKIHFRCTVIVHLEHNYSALCF